ncbi:14197_t:CDS:2, partial [Funneliformis geosporum]
LEKRLEQIEAHLAKFARKDTKGAKTPQRQRSDGHSNKSLNSKINNGSKPYKVNQDNNSPSTCNVSSEKGSQGRIGPMANGSNG